MRKSLNLVLAAGLAASAFASTAAAQQAAGCDNPDENEVVTKDGWEGSLSAGPVPGGAPIFYVHTLKYDSASKLDKDLTITITWGDGLDYDLEAWFVVGEEESERQESLGDQIGGDEAAETVTLTDVPNCADLKIGIQNYAGNPLGSVDAVIEVG